MRDSDGKWHPRTKASPEIFYGDPSNAVTLARKIDRAKRTCDGCIFLIQLDTQRACEKYDTPKDGILKWCTAYHDN